MLHRSLSCGSWSGRGWLLALVGLVGCSSPVVLESSGPDAFVGARSWSWDANGIQIEADRDPERLRERVRRHVTKALAERGFVHDPQAPDFLVTALVQIKRRIEVAQRPMAMYQLDSHHSSATWQISGTTLEERVVEDVRIGLGIRESHGDGRWLAATGDVVEEVHGLPAERLVSSLLDALPMPPAGPVPDLLPQPGVPGPVLSPERLADQ